MKGNDIVNYEEKIISLFQNGYLKTSDVVKNGIPKIYLTKLVKSNMIDRVARGLYSNKKKLDDELLIIQNQSKYAIYSNMTSLYILGYSDRVPIQYDITVPHGYKGSLQKNKRINLFYVKKEYTDLGITIVKNAYGNYIKIYDLEKSICDIIKNKNRVDRELFNKAIRNYYYSKEKDTLKLYDYAKKMNIYDKVKKAFEVLT